MLSLPSISEGAINNSRRPDKENTLAPSSSEIIEVNPYIAEVNRERKILVSQKITPKQEKLPLLIEANTAQEETSTLNEFSTKIESSRHSLKGKKSSRRIRIEEKNPLRKKKKNIVILEKDFVNSNTSKPRWISPSKQINSTRIEGSRYTLVDIPICNQNQHAKDISVLKTYKRKQKINFGKSISSSGKKAGFRSFPG